MATNNQSNSIKFPSRAKRDEGRLRDCFRIMAWKQFKQEYRGDLSGLQLYAVFEQDWKKHEIQTWNYQQMADFAETLGYTAGELLKARNRYYELRDRARVAAETKEQGMYQQPVYQPMYPMYQQPMQPAPVDTFQSDEDDDNAPF